MMRVREKQKEEEVEALKRSMQSGLVSFITVIIAFTHLQFVYRINSL